MERRNLLTGIPVLALGALLPAPVFPEGAVLLDQDGNIVDSAGLLPEDIQALEEHLDILFSEDANYTIVANYPICFADGSQGPDLVDIDGVYCGKAAEHIHVFLGAGEEEMLEAQEAFEREPIDYGNQLLNNV